jgi:tRNA-2-methylthio-N6-dimethylallyladenosine synthase
MAKYFLITYGCQMNKSDSERIASVLEKTGYRPTLDINKADLIVVNMCSVRQSAVDRVYGKIKDFAKLKAQNSKLKTILTGCILTKDKKKFAKKFDFVLSIKDLPFWQETLTFLLSNGRSKKNDINNKGEEENYLDIEPKYKNRFSFFVPISNGCDNACAYCAVPFTRGRLICRDHKKIIEEVKSIVKNGGKEIWLLGQNVNSYGIQRKTDVKFNAKPTQEINFAKLLKMVNEIPGKFWIRFTSPNPADFSDKLIKTIAECEKITPYLNLPVQSGNNTILKKMNRSYNITQYKNLVQKVRKKIPDISLSTDVIVGFPGETKKQFENTVKLFGEIKFDMAYIAKYSPRPGTAALKLKDNISQKEKNRREKVLTEILKKTALENNKKYIGKTTNVLADKYKGDFLAGKSFHYKTIKFKGTKNLIGKIIKVKITSALPWGLKGKLS